MLAGLTIDVMPGETVALVGVSGAGKSTLVSLIPRLYDVTSGAVRIDGHDVRDLTLESLRAAIGVVAQDPHLFHESIGDNLRYAKPDATTDELIAACRAARILDTVTALPDGFDTVVGDRGYRLSGGEKQRLAIARLLLKDPAVMILDEATSHLDNDNESQVQAALETALFGRTALVIAHRLSTIRRADRIAVLDERTHRRARDARRAGGPRRSLRRPAPRRHRRVHHHRPGLVTAPPLPLADLRVLDLSTVIAGPNCARYFADFGADVIKVERPGGDSLRNMAWRDERDGEGLWWKLTNRNKRNVVVDLKDPADLRARARASPTTPTCSSRTSGPGAWNGSVSAPEVLHARNPRLVITRVSGFGQDGPYAERPGFATIAEAMSGLSAISGEPDGPAAAPADRPDRRGHRSGRGVRHDGRPAQWPGPGRRHQPAGDDVPPDGSAAVGVRAERRAAAAPRRRFALHRAARARTAALTAGGSPCRRAATPSPPGCMELLGVGDDERFRTFAGRAAHRDELEAMMSDWCSRRPMDEALAELDAAEAAAGPVMDMAAIASRPALRGAPGSIADVDGTPMQALIARLSATPGALRWAGRPLDADGDEIRAHGWDRADRR